MNPKILEQLLLLEQSGELTAKQRRELDAELAASESARALRAELHNLRRVLPEPAPSPNAAANIAARLTQVSRPRPAFRPVWKPALAAVAALTLLLGVQTVRRGSPSVVSSVQLVQVESVSEEWTDPLENDFAELESLILAISDDPFGFEQL